MHERHEPWVRHLQGVPVVDGGKLVGIVSEHDLLRLVEEL